MKEYWLHQSALDFGKETKMGYLRNNIGYGCAYACAPHLVQLKWTHCQTIAWEIRVRCETVTFALTDMERFLEFLSLAHKSIVSLNLKWNEITSCFP